MHEQSINWGHFIIHVRNERYYIMLFMQTAMFQLCMGLFPFCTFVIDDVLMKYSMCGVVLVHVDTWRLHISITVFDF